MTTPMDMIVHVEMVEMLKVVSRSTHGIEGEQAKASKHKAESPHDHHSKNRLFCSKRIYRLLGYGFDLNTKSQHMMQRQSNHLSTASFQAAPICY